MLCTLVDQAIYGHVRLSAGSLAVWAECEPHDGRGAEPILLEAVSCSASGRRFESVERTAFPHTPASPALHLPHEWPEQRRGAQVTTAG